MNTASALDAFQQQFWTTLWAPLHDAAPPAAEWQQQPGWVIYRNTVIKGCVDSLQANYPAVSTLVGEDWFRAAAAEYATAHPPADRRMLFYGQDFDAFLAQFPPAAALPYLSGVALLDRLWREAHAATEAQRLTADELCRLTQSPNDLAAYRLHLHPSARWAWFDTLPVGALWRAAREHWADPNPTTWQGDGLLLTRDALGAVRWVPLCAGGAALLDACAGQLPLPQALEAAMAHHSGLDLPALLHTLLTAGAFSAIVY